MGVFLNFLPTSLALDTNPISQNFVSNFFCKLPDLPRL